MPTERRTVMNLSRSGDEQRPLMDAVHLSVDGEPAASLGGVAEFKMAMLVRRDVPSFLRNRADVGQAFKGRLERKLDTQLVPATDDPGRDRNGFTQHRRVARRRKRRMEHIKQAYNKVKPLESGENLRRHKRTACQQSPYYGQHEALPKKKAERWTDGVRGNNEDRKRSPPSQ